MEAIPFELDCGRCSSGAGSLARKTGEVEKTIDVGDVSVDGGLGLIGSPPEFGSEDCTDGGSGFAGGAPRVELDPETTSENVFDCGGEFFADGVNDFGVNHRVFGDDALAEGWVGFGEIENIGCGGAEFGGKVMSDVGRDLVAADEFLPIVVGPIFAAVKNVMARGGFR